MKILVVFVALAFVSQAAGECDGVDVDGSCYFWKGTKVGGLKFKKAEEACAEEGGHLAEFRTQQAYDTVRFYLLGVKPQTMLLIGMKYNYKKKNNPVMLRSGSAITYKPDWFENHPIDSHKNEEMVIIASKNSKFSGLMNSENGCRYALFLCEISLE
ncbi:uncharacterized protein LOC120331526 [Styela clava]|uniref:uncharacterized protein LOC120331526 n=1 Tax=Styela clava TaxID=7725 RepID=UPI001939FF18|nr:uncharacterized protein LOC120331526 [Styela clava]